MKRYQSETYRQITASKSRICLSTDDRSQRRDQRMHDASDEKIAYLE